MNDQKTKEQFIAFMHGIIENKSNHAKWKQNTEKHYMNNKLEEIRIRLIEICDKDDSFGDYRWPISDSTKISIQELINEIQSNIS